MTTLRDQNGLRDQIETVIVQNVIDELGLEVETTVKTYPVPGTEAFEGAEVSFDGSGEWNVDLHGLDVSAEYTQWVDSLPPAVADHRPLRCGGTMTTTTALSHDMLTIDASIKLSTAENRIDATMTTRCIRETMYVYHLAALIAQAGATEQCVAEFIEAVQAATWTLGLLLPTSIDEAGQDYAPGKTWLAQTATVDPHGDMRAGVRKLHALTTLAVRCWYVEPAEDEADARQMSLGSTVAIFAHSMPRKVRSPYDVSDIVSTLVSSACIVDAAGLRTENDNA